MRGVLLAGGTGTRLRPMTEVTNKHLLPVYDRPMLYFPLGTLTAQGCDEILVVVGRDHMGSVMQLLGSGAAHGCRLTYRVQDAAGGIAQALALADDFAHGAPLWVALGDNIYLPNPRLRHPGAGALVVLARHRTPQAYGVPEFDGAGRIVRVVEKPERPPSEYAVTGLYAYDRQVFDVIRTLEPSARGELEISDVNNWYAARGELAHAFAPGFWGDAGTVEGLHAAAGLVRASLQGGFAE